MKLLLDQNLAYSLKRKLGDLCPAIAHVEEFDLATAGDAAIWSLASSESFTIVTKDDDFRLMSIVRGHPPKVIYLKIGNCPLADVEQLIRGAWPLVVQLESDPSASLLLVTRETAFLLIHGKKTP